MIQVLDLPRTRTFSYQIPFDAVASLSAAASDAWEVERMVDPAGEVSIIVLPTSDDPALPTFMLYEKHGQARVATIRDDVWESDVAFTSGRQAVAAITAATEALAIAA